MLSKWLCVLSLILLIQNITADFNNYKWYPSVFDKVIDKSIDFMKFDKIFYNPITKLGLKGKLESFSRDRWAVGFSGIDCDCQGSSCSCCTGLNVTMLNFDRRTCVHLTYNPTDLSLEFKFAVNEKVLLNSIISGTNPPPFCIPVSPPLLTVCLRFFDIRTSGINLQACMDMQALMLKWPVLVLHFDCMKIGLDGVSWGKPEDGNLLPAFAPQGAMPEIGGPAVYDEVDFEINPTDLPNDQNTLIENDNIGQLKL